MKLDILKVFRALGSAHNNKVKTEASELWQVKVMSHIRSLEPLNSKTCYFALFDQFVWRFAATACFAAIILSVYVFQTGFQPEIELAKIYMENPIEFNLLESFEIL